MYRQKHPRTISQHIPTAYDGRGLGRDDPVWSCYVEEASKWDADLVDGWNKGMDVILLFAALFSAIVTAFLIESYQMLKPDNQEITANGIVDLVGLLQAVATGQPPNITNIKTSSRLDFQPSTISMLINVSWFLSLTLSVTVALLAMLVKQWGEGYQSGHGLTPPSVQSRIRQARYDNMKRWRTEDIVMALPVLMHAALGLFLLGLLLFLNDLNRNVMAPVMVVVIATLAFYLATTLMPLVVPFCPYNTPVSSSRFWLLFCHIFGFTDPSGRIESWLTPKCQQQEKDISENTAPDSVTTRALEWLIRHSQDKISVDIAIRAISSTELDSSVWKLLAQDSLIMLVAQKFTALFGGTLDHDLNVLYVKDKQHLLLASSYGRALANIVKHISLQSDANQHGYTSQEDGVSHIETILSKDQVAAVERGLSLLAFSQCNVVAASGITSISAWYTATNRERQNREKWKQTLSRLIEILVRSCTARDKEYAPLQTATSRPTSRATSRATSRTAASRDRSPRATQSRANCSQADTQYADSLDIQAENSNRIDNPHDCFQGPDQNSDAFISLTLALPVEISQWRWDLSKQEKFEILGPLLQLLELGLLEGASQVNMSAALATLAMLVNDHPEVQATELNILRPKSDELYGVSKAHAEWEERYHPGSQVDEFYVPVQQSNAQATATRSRRAQWTSYLCTTDANYLVKYSDSLLVLGLAGLLDSLDELGVVDIDPGLATRIAVIVATQLQRIHIINQSDPIILPYILPATYDVRIYLMDVITRTLDSSPFEGKLDSLPTEAKVALLQYLSEKKHLWFDFGSQLLMPVIQLLHSDESIELQSLCLAAIDEYCITNSAFDPRSSPNFSFYHNPVDWQLFFALEVPYKLVKIVCHNARLRSRATSTLYSIMAIVPTGLEEQSKGVAHQISRTVKRIILEGLFETLAIDVLCRSGHQHTNVWRDEIIRLPGALTQDEDDESVRAELRKFCENHPKESGLLYAFVFALKEKLGMHASL